ncbi:SDR family oxidoreductase [Lacisediminihabitans profunda]|uniref:SDR family oxidoreductase n=1 Tax=Lacisediminihabitans profunda TaxID=2594790 RepID=A0A5C8UYI6_9MICO|nr:SDR family oxidoreductase [Lacisediminihabitans profunda]TXN32806.1 SDR family oxidoreductase [Lacisediminihabitans profunda]
MTGLARFTGSTALVTGASRGIGFAVAERLVAEGARVVITGRGEDALRSAAERLGPPGTALWLAGRADDAEHRTAVFHLIDARTGGLDHFVSNVGINPHFGPLLDIDPGLLLKILGTNVVSALAWAREAVEHGLGERHGSVVNVASVAGLGATPGIGAYGVSKAALISLTTQLALELAPRIRVNAVAPAVVKTDFARALYEGREAEVAAGYPLGRLGTPADVAGAVAFLLSEDAAWITGQTLVIDGGAMLRPVF